MIEKEEKLDRRQVRCFVDDADWIEEEVTRREKVVGRRKVWPAHVVREAIALLKAANSSSAPQKSMISSKEAGQLEQFREFLRSAPKQDVHMVLSLMERFTDDVKETSQKFLERKSGGR